jgi:hypothetical protein
MVVKSQSASGQSLFGPIKGRHTLSMQQARQLWEQVTGYLSLSPALFPEQTHLLTTEHTHFSIS